jgi:hypothetical protein
MHTSNFSDRLRYPLEAAAGGGGGGSGRTLRRGCYASEEAVNWGMVAQHE